MTPNTPKNAGKSLFDTCTSNLNSIGIFMGSTPKTIKVSYNALKHIKIDKIKVQPKAGTAGSGEVNPFSLSDGEDSEDDSSLLSRLVKDITNVDLDDLDLGTKICDLKVSGRKSKSSSKKEKARKRAQKTKKGISPLKASIGIAEVYQTWLNTGIYQKLSEITTLTLSPSWRPGNKTCLEPTLTDFREVRISFGIVYRQVDVRVAFFWG